MGHVFISRAVPGRALDLLTAAGHSVETWPGDLPPPPETLGAKLAAAHVAFTTVVDFVSTGMLAAAPRLKIVANMAVGYDNVDPVAAAGMGISDEMPLLKRAVASLGRRRACEVRRLLM